MKPMCWTHPKFARLRIRLKTDIARAAGILEGLWHLTATFEPDTGRVPFTPNELMDWFMLDETLCGFTADQLLQALVDAKFVDCRDGQLYVHDWSDHRPFYLEHRISQKRYRDKHKKTPRVVENVNHGDVTVTDSDVPSASASASVCSSSKNKKPPLSPKGETIKSMMGIELPKSIDTVEVRASLTEWLQYKGGYKRVGITKLVSTVSDWLPERIIAAVDHSIACKYAGLFEPTNGHAKKHKTLTLLPEDDE